MSYSNECEDGYPKIGLLDHDLMPHDFQEIAFSHRGTAPIQPDD